MQAHRRPHVFIGSSREQLRFAEAVQNNLGHDFETTVWNQDVFKASQYPLESLLLELARCDFGIFVLAPDDILMLRGKRYSAPRDNVVFELGMFTGRLGRERAFIVLPRHSSRYRLPTDLLGLTPVEYDGDRSDGNLIAALGPACSALRQRIHSVVSDSPYYQHGVKRLGMFTPDFTSRLENLLASASTVTTYFIHSRRWRENNDHLLQSFIRKKGSKLEVFLPDLANARLIEKLQEHFDDGRHLPEFISDAYRYFALLQRQCASAVAIRAYQLYPTYSFYLFDKETVVVAFYPTTFVRKNVPTLELGMMGDFGQFIAKDLKELRKTSRNPSKRQIGLWTRDKDTP